MPGINSSDKLLFSNCRCLPAKLVLQRKKTPEKITKKQVPRKKNG